MQRVGVIGGGLMGSGIAEVSARAGLDEASRAVLREGGRPLCWGPPGNSGAEAGTRPQRVLEGRLDSTRMANTFVSGSPAED